MLLDERSSCGDVLLQARRALRSGIGEASKDIATKATAWNKWSHFLAVCVMCCLDSSAQIFNAHVSSRRDTYMLKSYDYMIAIFTTYSLDMLTMADDDLFDERLRERCPTAKLETSAFSKSEVVSSRSQAGPSRFTSA